MVTEGKSAIRVTGDLQNSTYVDYIINQIDSDNKLGVGSDDTVAVGIVYQF